MTHKKLPLSDAEYVELDAFLQSPACRGEALSVEEAHGFLTALVVGPESMDIGEWMEAVWGHPRFSDSTEKERMEGLLVRMHGQIADTLREGQTFEPLVVEEEEEGEIFESVEGWCLGFMLGVERRQQVWDPLPKDQQSLLAPIAELALLLDEETPDMDEAEYAAWVELLPGAVAGLYRFWHG